MAESMQSKIDAAIKDIRRLHAIGRKSLKKPGKRAPKLRIDEDAKRLRMNRFTLRKARRFADVDDEGEGEGYSKDDLNNLCSQIQGQKPIGKRETVFCRSHLIRLLDVPKSDRPSFQADAIKQGWTYQRLGAEIAKKFGRRRIGGKRPRMPDDRIGVYEEIEKRCISWQRWNKDLSNHFKDPSKSENAIGNIAKKIKKLLADVTDSMERLHAGVSAALKDNNPTRTLAEETVVTKRHSG